MSIEHDAPVYPAAQVQVYVTPLLEHVASFWHGEDAHSSISVAHVEPVYPVAHTHAKEPTLSPQIAPFSQGLDAH